MRARNRVTCHMVCVARFGLTCDEPLIQEGEGHGHHHVQQNNADHGVYRCRLTTTRRGEARGGG